MDNGHTRILPPYVCIQFFVQKETEMSRQSFRYKGYEPTVDERNVCIIKDCKAVCFWSTKRV